MSPDQADIPPPPGLAGAAFADLAELLAAGDEAAAREVHRRYTRRLIALARQRLPAAVRSRTDPESVVQSVYRSFFGRAANDEFALGNWDDLWGLLARIAVRKCLNRVRFHRQGCRDVGREDGGAGWAVADPDPSPDEVAALHETVAAVFAGLGGRDRGIVEALLQGCTVEEARARVGCGERTVRRVRERVRDQLRGAP
jgi:DNA-directed RNA polymerase specialized sigma24 family protein